MVLWLIFGALKDLQQLRRHSEALDLYQRLASVLELSRQAPPTTVRPEYDALLEELKRLEQDEPLSFSATLPSEDSAQMPLTEARREALRLTLQTQIDELRRTEMPLLWGALRGRLWLLSGLWTIWALVALFKLWSEPSARREGSDTSSRDDPTLATPPLSFTQMALGTVQTSDKPASSARGYTERVLQSLSNLLILAGPDESIQMVNEAICTKLDYPRGELLGKPLSLILGTNQAEPGLKNRESSFKTSGGQAVPVLLSCSAVLDGRGEVEGLVIVAQDITEQKLAEQSLKSSEKRLRELMERLVSAQEDERQKVARDLHDGMLQLVIAAEMQLTTFRKKVIENTPQAGDPRLKNGIECLSEAVKEGRRLINNLRPPTLDKFGLAQSLRQETAKLARELNCEFKFECEIGRQIIPTAIETTVFRICQEALNNVRKHCLPETLSVRLVVREGNLILTVEDDGASFDPLSPEFNGGLGLHSMRERAELHGGSFELQARPQEGTKIIAVLPLEAR